MRKDNNPRSFALVLSCAVALLACKALKKEQPEPASSAAATTPAGPQETTFTRAVPKPGTQIAAERNMVMKFTFNGKVYRESNGMNGTMTVQSSDEFRVTKAAVDVKELYTVKQEGSGDEKRSVSPLAGSRYVIARADDGALSALDASGNKVPGTQLKLIKDEFASAFEKDQTGAFLPDRPLKPGERFSPASDSVMKMLDIKDDGKTLIDGIEFTYASSNADRANFDVGMTMTMNIGSGLRLRAKLKGLIAIKPQGAFLVAVDLTGPLEILDASGKEKGNGELSFKGTQTYSGS